MSGPGSPEDPRSYVRAVIDAYVHLTATAAQARREDRRLAAELHARGVPFEVMEAALLLGVARKARPSTETSPRTTIRSLHYFLPVVEEIMRDPLPASYIDYLREVVAGLAAGEDPGPGGTPCGRTGGSSKNYVSR